MGGAKDDDNRETSRRGGGRRDGSANSPPLDETPDVQGGRSTASTQRALLDETHTQEALEIEQQSLQKVEKAVGRMRAALELQEQTTGELRLQGEKLKNIKETAISLHRNAEAASRSTHRLKQSSSMFPGLGSVVRSVKRWWSRDRHAERYIERVQTRPVEAEPEEAAAPVEAFEPLAQEVVPGENKTDARLSELLTSVRRVKEGATRQVQMVKAQARDADEIGQIGKYAEDVVSETERAISKK